MRSTTTSKLYDFSLGWKAKITTLYTWKRLMARYFSSPNEQHPQRTAEVMRNFSPLLHDEVYPQPLFSSDEVNRWAATRWHLVHKKMFSRGNNPWEWKWPLGTLRFSFLFFNFLHSEWDGALRRVVQNMPGSWQDLALELFTYLIFQCKHWDTLQIFFFHFYSSR